MAGMGSMGTGGLATLCALASTIIIIVYHVQNKPSNGHALFSTVGYFLFLVALSWVNYMTNLYLDWIIMIIGLVLAILGLIVHVKDQGMDGTDIHGYLGIAGLVCYAIAFIICIVLFFFIKGAVWAFYLNFVLTRAALCLGGFALITGLLKDNYKSWAPTWLFYLHIVLVIIYTVFMFLAVVFAL